MKLRLAALPLIVLLACTLVSASAYNGQPKLVVVIIIDQFRGDYLDRAHDQLGPDGFRLFTDRGAYFASCNYDYANTRTAPGHATLFTGAYSNGHGILANEWWDPSKKKMVISVEDDATHSSAFPSSVSGASPRNLQIDTIGDELKLATKGKARVFAISLKDRCGRSSRRLQCQRRLLDRPHVWRLDHLYLLHELAAHMGTAVQRLGTS